MLRNRRAYILIAIIIIASSILCFQKLPRKEEPVLVASVPVVDSTQIKMKDRFQAYEPVFEKGIEACKCPGAAVVVVKDTSVVFIKGFGTRRARGTEPVDAHTVFRLGSLSKGFAAVVAGTLVEKGYFSWDDRVREYYPEFELKSEAQADRIRIYHILSHTTGLIRHAYTNLVEEGWSLDRIIPLLKDVTLTGKEGENYAYQNVAYAMIEKVIKATTHQDYKDILRNEIFDRLGMKDASCTYEGLINSKDKAYPNMVVARNYVYAKTRITKKYYNVVAAGGVNASASDMGQWLKLLLGNRPDIISDNTLDRIFQPIITTTREREFYDRWKETSASYYAMGWRVLDFDNRRIEYHGGYVNGYRSEIAVDRENKVAVCALFNAPCEYAKYVVRDFLDFYDSNFQVQHNRMVATKQDLQ